MTSLLSRSLICDSVGFALHFAESHTSAYKTQCSLLFKMFQVERVFKSILKLNMNSDSYKVLFELRRLAVAMICSVFIHRSTFKTFFDYLLLIIFWLPCYGLLSCYGCLEGYSEVN